MKMNNTVSVAYSTAYENVLHSENVQHYLYEN